MQVNGVNTTYSAALQYKYFFAVISEDQLEVLLRRYGITPTGDKDKDMEALYQAMRAVATSDLIKMQAASQLRDEVTSAPKTGEQQKTNAIPWGDLMTQVGLSTTGDLNNDYSLFLARINAMQNSASTSPENRAYIDMLMAQASVVFVQPESTAKQNEASVSPSKNNSQSISGADLVAQINRMYMLGV